MPSHPSIVKSVLIAVVAGVAVGVATTYLLPLAAVGAAGLFGSLGTFGTSEALLAPATATAAGGLFSGAQFAAGTIGLFFGISGGLGVLANALLSPQNVADAPLPDTAGAAPIHSTAPTPHPILGKPTIAHAATPAPVFAGNLPIEPPPGTTIRLPEPPVRLADTASPAPVLH